MKRALCATAIASVHALATAAPARAQPVQPVPAAHPQPVPIPDATSARATSGVGRDTVFLKNGGMIRGDLIELLPNDHVTIGLASGQSAIVQWSQVQRIEQGAPVSASTPAEPSPTPAPPISGPTVLVHIESPRPVTLLRKTSDGIWHTTCSSPCDLWLPKSDEYRIGGSGVTQSNDFDLEGASGQRVILSVNVGTTAGLTGGLIGAGVGLITFIVGVYVIAIAAAAKSMDCISTTSSSCSSSSSSSGGVVAGAALMVGGVAAMAVGGIVALSHSKSGVSQEVQSRKTGLSGASNAWARLPTWREDALIPATPAVVPLFAREF